MITYPQPFLAVRVQELNSNPEIVTLCAGYQSEKWRAEQFAEDLMQWLPYAALSQEDQLSFGMHNYRELVHRASLHIYSKKNESRGEIGELLLHQACIQYHNASPVICKLILKTSPNDVVKGYDGVFVVATGDDFEIWLGEAKFYTDADSAVQAAIKSIRDHFLDAFINAEKGMIVGHITPSTPFYDKLLKLFTSQASADDLFAKAVFPVLITYESTSVNTAKSVTEAFREGLRMEAVEISKKFGNFLSDKKINIQLILVPLLKKKLLLDAFDRRLGGHLIEP
ncbi:DUF1837 domain-containing protein (plasmid) [Rhizobium leguminosarum]|uniref:HamA C-terminal domain-containing protein n=1 Tax=Rhizobium leguminosarum TaxID=384 RepID=UPI0010302187|nr:DUF1837 domain-containing protein [Rhizobium leguminosarum]TAX87145.1 DUF1837 domain-containing protein [Rhizobium leguminosarum]